MCLLDRVVYCPKGFDDVQSTNEFTSGYLDHLWTSNGLEFSRSLWLIGDSYLLLFNSIFRNNEELAAVIPSDIHECLFVFDVLTFKLLDFSLK